MYRGWNLVKWMIHKNHPFFGVSSVFIEIGRNWEIGRIWINRTFSKISPFSHASLVASFSRTRRACSRLIYPTTCHPQRARKPRNVPQPIGKTLTTTNSPSSSSPSERSTLTTTAKHTSKNFTKIGQTNRTSHLLPLFVASWRRSVLEKPSTEQGEQRRGWKVRRWL